MGAESLQGRGSMFGVVDSQRQMVQAMEELLMFLPDDFVWPTQWHISPFSAYVELGRDNSTEEMTQSVWFTASPEGVKMNANFRPNWPECGASDFDAKVASEWLLELTKNWEWNVTRRDGGGISSSLRRPA